MALPSLLISSIPRAAVTTIKHRQSCKGSLQCHTRPRQLGQGSVVWAPRNMHMARVPDGLTTFFWVLDVQKAVSHILRIFFLSLCYVLPQLFLIGSKFSLPLQLELSTSRKNFSPSGIWGLSSVLVLASSLEKCLVCWEDGSVQCQPGPL